MKNESDIKNINDLKFFLKKSKFGTNINGENKEKFFKNINSAYLLSPEEHLKYEIGSCYDDVFLEQYFLTKWNIPFEIYFQSSNKHISKYKDYYHIFLIYELNNEWYTFEKSECRSYENKEKLLDVILNNILKIRSSNGIFEIYLRKIDNVLVEHLKIIDLYKCIMKNKIIKTYVNKIDFNEFNMIGRTKYILVK